MVEDTEETHQAPVEHVAEDLRDIWEQAERLRKVVEKKIAGWVDSREAKVNGWAKRLEGFVDRLEGTLDEFSEHTDNVAQRRPRDPMEDL
jgi:hypothetical protein